MNKLSEKQTMIVTIAVFAVVSIGLGGYAFYLWNSQVTPKRASVTQKKAELETEKKNGAMIPVLMAQLKDLEKKQAEFKEKLPSADEVQLEAFRKTLTNFATAANVMIVAVRPAAQGTGAAQPPGGQAAVKPFEEISFNLDVKGNFATLGNFIYMIETHRRLIKVEQLDLKPEAVQSSTGVELPKVIPASLTLKLTTYQFK